MTEPLYEHVVASADVLAPGGDARISLVVSWPVGSKEGLASAAVALPAFVARFERDLARRAVEYLQIDQEIEAFSTFLNSDTDTEGPAQ